MSILKDSNISRRVFSVLGQNKSSLLVGKLGLCFPMMRKKICLVFDIQREPNTLWPNCIQSNAEAFFANGSNKANNFVLMLTMRPNKAGGRPLALKQLIQFPWEHRVMLS